MNKIAHKCLSLTKDLKGVTMVTCNSRDTLQKWKWSRKRPEENIDDLLKRNDPKQTEAQFDKYEDYELLGM